MFIDRVLFGAKKSFKEMRDEGDRQLKQYGRARERFDVCARNLTEYEKSGAPDNAHVDRMLVPFESYTGFVEICDGWHSKMALSHYTPPSNRDRANILYCVFDKKQPLAKHYHPFREKIFILSGSIEVRLYDSPSDPSSPASKVILDKHSSLEIPEGVSHSVMPLEDGDLMALFSPPMTFMEDKESFVKHREESLPTFIKRIFLRSAA